MCIPLRKGAVQLQTNAEVLQKRQIFRQALKTPWDPGLAVMSLGSRSMQADIDVVGVNFPLETKRQRSTQCVTV